MAKRNARKSKSVVPAAPVAVAAPEVIVPPVAVPLFTMIKASPSHEQIARRAYELYLARGAKHGCALEDWVGA